MQHVKTFTLPQICRRTNMNTVDKATNDTTKEAIAFEQNNENEIRYYLKQIKALMTEPEEGENRVPFVPTYFITAVKLPTGAIELAVNTSDIANKIDYILDAYDYAMRLKTNENIVMQNLMVV